MEMMQSSFIWYICIKFLTAAIISKVTPIDLSNRHNNTMMDLIFSTASKISTQLDYLKENPHAEDVLPSKSVWNADFSCYTRSVSPHVVCSL